MKNAGWIWFMVGILVLGLMAYWIKRPEKVGPGTVARAASRAAKQVTAQKTVEMAIIVSPNEIGIAKDSIVNRLISQHNQREDRLAKVALRGTCTWEVDGPAGTPRPMAIAFTRAGQEAEVTCGPQRGRVRMGMVTMDFNSVINVDCLYLLVFRRFDPEDFHVVPSTADEGEVVMESKTEKLTFDAESGRLVEAQVSSPAGPVVARFGDFVAMGGEGKVEMPTTIAVTVPKKLYPVVVKSETGLATFNVEVGQSRIGD